MRTGSVFVLLVVTLIACCNGFASAESAVGVNTQHAESINTPVSNGIIRRNLRVAGIPGSNFVNKLTGIFKRNPGLSKQVESMQKDPAKFKALEKAAKTEGFTSKLRAHFKQMSDNSSKMDKAFIAATIILFIISVPMVWKVYGTG